MKEIVSVVLTAAVLCTLAAATGCSEKPAEKLQFGLGVTAGYGSTTDADGDTNGAGAPLEWNEQADVFMKTVTGKTLDEAKAYMGEDNYPTGDLATAGCYC